MKSNPIHGETTFEHSKTFSIVFTWSTYKHYYSWQSITHHNTWTVQMTYCCWCKSFEKQIPVNTHQNNVPRILHIFIYCCTSLGKWWANIFHSSFTGTDAIIWLVSGVHNYHTHQFMHLYVPHVPTNLGESCVSYHIPKIWNINTSIIDLKMQRLFFKWLSRY